MSVSNAYLLRVRYCNPELEHSRLFNLSAGLPRSEHNDGTSIDDVLGRILPLTNVDES